MRLIDADALLTAFPVDDEPTLTKSCVRMTIKHMPTIEPERKKGKWIPQDHNKRNGMITTAVYYYPKCSECGHVGDYSMNFCPSCGADMRGEQDETN